MFGGCVHSIDVLRAFGGDVAAVHANARKGKLTKAYPLADNFFLNLRFASGAIGRVSGLYGIVHPPTPMMQFGIYGTKGSLQAEFTDNQPGQIRVVLDKLPGHKPMVSLFEPERDLSAYGHGATVIRYMRHFQDCLDADREPSPGVLDGAKAVAVGVAAWESVRTGQATKPFNAFRPAKITQANPLRRGYGAMARSAAKAAPQSPAGDHFERRAFGPETEPDAMRVINAYIADWPYSKPVTAELVAHWKTLGRRYQPEEMALVYRQGKPTAFIHGEKNKATYQIHLLAMVPGAVSDGMRLIEEAEARARAAGAEWLRGPTASSGDILRRLHLRPGAVPFRPGH